jgi:ferredoxin
MAFAVQHTSRLGAAARPAAPRRITRLAPVRSHKVEITHEGKTVTLDVPEGQSILEVALDKGIDLPHDCKLGVCMTCPAKLVSKLMQLVARESKCVDSATSVVKAALAVCSLLAQALQPSQGSPKGEDASIDSKRATSNATVKLDTSSVHVRQ